MNSTMIVNRTTDWFVFDDIHNDPFYLSILLLEKLSTRTKMGLKYDRLQLINDLVDQKSVKSLKTLDQAIVLLSSRSLIELKTHKDGLTTTIYINEKGKRALEGFRKELKNATSKNKG
ncbi:hypothetical protein DFO73_103452 [Cytobacillus oceanisediminis]|uniref:HTH marR-type domain-containing protein n=1 Tax=Cytobacillus oceanisediminis TaxID=665099 RepID=A0A2V3A1R4_9BACI|nr:hypothetical protein [Cytobacillus oceanisediminis]PWW30558.1 hypothetical protein DFO73_103452 [Cytobacillus oceanisediminis]